MKYVANDSDYGKLRDATPSGSFSQNNDTFCSSGHVHIELAFSKRQERNGKNGDRLVARQQPPTLPFYFFHLSSTAARRSARFSIRYRDNEVLIASGNRFESQCSGIHVFRPAFFPPFFNTSFLFGFNRCFQCFYRESNASDRKALSPTTKVLSTIFPVTDRFTSAKTFFHAFFHPTLFIDYLSHLVPPCSIRTVLL